MTINKHYNGVRNARKMRVIGPRFRSAVYARCYVSSVDWRNRITQFIFVIMFTFAQSSYGGIGSLTSLNATSVSTVNFTNKNKRKYQLALQFKSTQLMDYDILVVLENRLRRGLGISHYIDGHDFGSGEVNIFIHTNDPLTAFELVKSKLTASELKALKSAYRRFGADKYKVIWPKGYTGKFNVK